MCSAPDLPQTGNEQAFPPVVPVYTCLFHVAPGQLETKEMTGMDSSGGLQFQLAHGIA